jgi:hypothetical protein
MLPGFFIWQYIKIYVWHTLLTHQTKASLTQAPTFGTGGSVSN